MFFVSDPRPEELHRVHRARPVEDGTMLEKSCSASLDLMEPGPLGRLSKFGRDLFAEGRGVRGGGGAFGAQDLVVAE